MKLKYINAIANKTEDCEVEGYSDFPADFLREIAPPDFKYTGEFEHDIERLVSWYNGMGYSHRIEIPDSKP